MSPILTGVIASGISGHLTPPWSPEGAFDALASVTVPSGGLSSIEFSGIPTGYKHLQLRGLVRNTGFDAGGARQNLRIQFNNDTGSNYNSHGLIGNGTSASSYFETVQTSAMPSYGMIPMTDATANIFGAHIIDILDYANLSKFKTLRFLGGVDTNNSTSGYSNLGSGAWRNTNSIASITIFPQAGAFAEFSSYALYGVK
jgi:hypothetical protein